MHTESRKRKGDSGQLAFGDAVQILPVHLSAYMRAQAVESVARRAALDIQRTCLAITSRSEWIVEGHFAEEVATLGRVLRSTMDQLGTCPTPESCCYWSDVVEAVDSVVVAMDALLSDGGQIMSNKRRSIQFGT